MPSPATSLSEASNEAILDARVCEEYETIAILCSVARIAGSQLVCSRCGIAEEPIAAIFSYSEGDSSFMCGPCYRRLMPRYRIV